LSEARLRQLVELVTTWSAKINLVSKNDIPLLWERHVLDSLALAPLIPEGVEFAIDLGSGAGFPGLVLAIATGIPFTLIESDARKAAFLMEAGRQTGAQIKVLNGRIEAAKIAPAMLVTARALAPLDKLLHLAAPLLAPGGVCLFPKGRNVESELAQARVLWQMEAKRFANAAGGADACILRLSGVSYAGAAPKNRRDL
jgi:16S rRNA (guanine527-N7)-methyltransferase